MEYRVVLNPIGSYTEVNIPAEATSNDVVIVMVAGKRNIKWVCYSDCWMPEKEAIKQAEYDAHEYNDRKLYPLCYE